MTVRTLFQSNGRFESGQVEVKLLPGLPMLHIVGLPDASIRECGIRIKSALKSCGLEWPKAQQIVVSLRPSEMRKGGAGVELAVALCYLAQTGQITEPMREVLRTHHVWGELALNGDVISPAGIERALQSHARILTGAVQGEVRRGEWLEIKRLLQDEPVLRKATHARDTNWNPPSLPELFLNKRAARDLVLTVHLGLNALVAGPQGTGKTTWARMAHALSPAPDEGDVFHRVSLFGEASWFETWRPLEQPHHTVTTKAMIGGGLPLRPGVISRAHGGVLLMDEFLEFAPEVLEALREPVEGGWVDLARNGVRARFPAKFQLIATSNLCPCGRLDPGKPISCSYSGARCRSTVQRMSGPVLDRFDWLVPSHSWLDHSFTRPVSDLRAQLEELGEFRSQRAKILEQAPGWVAGDTRSFRRRNSVLRLARGLADLELRERVSSADFDEAHGLVVEPMEELRKCFG